MIPENIDVYNSLLILKTNMNNNQVILSLDQVNNLMKLIDGINKSNSILKGIVNISKDLVENQNNTNFYVSILKSLGESTNVSRCYIHILNDFDEVDICHGKELFEWYRDSVGKRISTQLFARNTDGSISKWHDCFKKENPFLTSIYNADEFTKRMMEKNNTISMALFPIILNNEVWGLIGLDDCKYDRIWNETEINSLKIAVNFTGIIVKRKQEQEAVSNIISLAIKDHQVMIEQINKKLALEEQ
ncbi:MAG: GAF domain-containing protein [Candidatus Helarchaeota archaeon]